MDDKLTIRFMFWAIAVDLPHIAGPVIKLVFG